MYGALVHTHTSAPNMSHMLSHPVRPYSIGQATSFSRAKNARNTLDVLAYTYVYNLCTRTLAALCECLLSRSIIYSSFCVCHTLSVIVVDFLAFRICAHVTLAGIQSVRLHIHINRPSAKRIFIDWYTAYSSLYVLYAVSKAVKALLGYRLSYTQSARAQATAIRRSPKISWHVRDARICMARLSVPKSNEWIKVMRCGNLLNSAISSLSFI